MKKENYKEVSTQDLNERLAKMEKDYKQLVATHAVTPVDNPSKITAARREIARVKTELRARQLAGK